MTAKTTRVYTLDELKEKCRKALNDQTLVEIVKNAPLNKYGKVNLSWVDREAKKYILEQTKDLQMTKELAKETRNLAMLRRDHLKEFEKLIAQEKQPKSEVESVKPKKEFSEMEFDLTGLPIKITTQNECIYGEIRTTKQILKFLDVQWSKDSMQEQRIRNAGIKFCMDILNALVETADASRDLLPDLIQVLEEKFGLKVKVCGNCKFYNRFYEKDNEFVLTLRDGLIRYGECVSSRNPSNTDPKDYTKVSFDSWCEYWTPKEVSEKKEN